jgi:hypothetical protein
MKRKDRGRDRGRGMDRDSDIERGKNIDNVDTACMASFRYFSPMSICFARKNHCFASKRNFFAYFFASFRFEAKRAAHPRRGCSVLACKEYTVPDIGLPFFLVRATCQSRERYALRQ